jgi:tetratricopeptide (TPR) repeat protein
MVKRVTELQPRDADNYTRLGWTYWLHGQLDDARSAFERAVALDPWNALGSNNLTAFALALVASGRRGDAIEMFKEAYFTDPRLTADDEWFAITRPDGEPDRVLDPAYFPRDDLDYRLRVLLRDRLLAQPEIPGPTLPPAPIRTLYLSEVLESAYTDYQAELSSDRDRAAGMLSAIARAYASAGLHDRAVELLTELAGLAPEERYVQYDLGLSYAALGRSSEAEQAFRRTIELADARGAYDIYEPFAHYRLGALFLEAGDHERALDEFRATLDTYRWPYFPEAYQGLAQAALATGQDEEAESTLRRLSFLLDRDVRLPVGTVTGAER